MNSYATLCGPPDGSCLPIIKELIGIELKFDTKPFLLNKTLVWEEAFAALHWSRQVEYPWVIKNAELKPGMTVLDVGSGPGPLAFALADRCSIQESGGLVCCLDPNKDYMENLESNPFRTAFYRGKVIPRLGDGCRMPYLDGAFDRVVCVSALEHFAAGTHMQAIKEMQRVLKPDGLMLLTLDLVADGLPGGGSGYEISTQDFGDLLTYLEIPPNFPLPNPMLSCYIEGRTIVVGLIRWVKPKQL